MATAATALLAAACVRGTDHERLGDRRYAERSWPDALAEYRLAVRRSPATSELRAKLAMAALHAQALGDAAQAWRDLGKSDPGARDLAAEGLMRTALAAIEARDVAAVRAAVEGLRHVAPGRLAELGSGLLEVLDDPPRPEDADLALAAAAASQGAQADSLVAAWADASARSGRCDLAARAYDALRRRNRTPAITRAARRGLAGCQVESGRAALAAGQLDQAEAAFRAAIDVGVPDSTVRTAWLLIGDARWAAGDTATALDSYRKAILGGDEDSPVVRRAREQIQKLAGTPVTP
ncbi:MAG: tol-pal system YbgF family protein [Gemmatimonadales bacterium]